MLFVGVIIRILVVFPLARRRRRSSSSFDAENHRCQHQVLQSDVHASCELARQWNLAERILPFAEASSAREATYVSCADCMCVCVCVCVCVVGVCCSLPFLF